MLPNSSFWDAKETGRESVSVVAGEHDLGMQGLTCLMRSGLTVVCGWSMLTGSVLAALWGISRTFSAMKSWTLLRASTVPWIKHTRSVVPAKDREWEKQNTFLIRPSDDTEPRIKGWSWLSKETILWLLILSVLKFQSFTTHPQWPLHCNKMYPVLNYHSISLLVSNNCNIFQMAVIYWCSTCCWC